VRKERKNYAYLSNPCCYDFF